MKSDDNNMTEFIREAKLAGSWYPGREKPLKNLIEASFLSKFGPEKLPEGIETTGDRNIIGIISPHAGFTFSGGIAANGYYEIAKDGIPDTILLIGSHGGFNEIYTQTMGKWNTPLGDLHIDEQIALKIAKHSPTIIEANDKMVSMNYTDNTFELQLPFIRYLSPDIKIVPIAAGSRHYPKIQDAGKDLASNLRDYFKQNSEKRVIIVASTDLTHYGSNFNFMPAIGQSPEKQNEWIKTNDMRVIKMIKNLKQNTPEGILQEATNHRNLCCPGAITLALETIVRLAESFNTKISVKFLKQATSFEVEPGVSNPNFFSAVGYASLVVKFQ
mgnify:CR=1 FL=1